MLVRIKRIVTFAPALRMKADNKKEDTFLDILN